LAGDEEVKSAVQESVISEGAVGSVPAEKAAPPAEEPEAGEDVGVPSLAEELVAVPALDTGILCCPGKICVIKFLDTNENGEMDAGETGLAGVTIKLNDGNEKVTGEDGKVCYDGLEPGSYTVSEIVPAGYHATTQTSYCIEICWDQSKTVYFGNAPDTPLNGSITGHKWLDPNGDGSFEDVTPLAGVTIELWKDGEKKAETTTAADGSYSFSDLEPGDYTVKEIVPGNMEALSPTSVDVGVAEGQDAGDVDFYNKKKICEDGVIEALVKVDENCNGVIDGEDSLLDGVTIELYHIEKDGSLTPAVPPSQVTGPGWGIEVFLYYWWIDVYYPGGHVIWNDLPRAYAGEEFAWYLLKMIPPEGYTVIGPSEYELPLRNCPLPCWWYRKEFLLGKTFHINGYKYEDVNCNGEIDEGDTGVPGVEIKLFIYNEQSGEYEYLASTVTDGNGYYEFTGLGDGVYKVQEILTPELLEEWYIVSPEGGVYEGLEVGCGDSYDDLDFLNARYISISGNKWEDLNCNGELDEGEPPVEGITIELWKDGEKKAETTTAADGSYSFTNLVPGTYTVKEVLPEGWHPTAPEDGMYEDIQLVCGQPIDGLDFLNARNKDINGHKYEDKNCDGEIDEGDTGVPGIEIMLFKYNEQSGEYEYLASTFTGEDGYYEFTGLMPGTYKVQEILTPELLEDWYIVSPDGGIFEPVVLECQTIEDLDFLNARYGAIEGWKYWDKDENGIMDNEDEGLAGVTIILTPEVGEAQETVTDEDGYFFFDGLMPGNYTVSVDESTAEGYFPVSPVSIEVDVTCGTTVKVYFSEAPYGSISGKKWLDADFDGIWDEEETEVIEGITIKLYAGDPPEELIATTVTGEDGYYEFTDLEPGEYTVVEEGKEGYFSCTPVNVVVDLSAGEGAVVDFGNCPYGRVEGLKFLDLDGDGAQGPDEPPLEGVEITLIGLGDTGAMAKAFSGEDGTFVFNNLLPGEYAVEETVPSGYYATRPIRVEIVVGPGESVMVVFANALYGSITGNKWLDDGDGQFDPDKDTPKAGIELNLSGETADGTPVSMKGTTGEDGSYTFLLLEAGTYNVAEVFDTTKMKAVSPDNVDVELAPGGEETVDFLNVEVEVGGEVIEQGETLPATGMDQMPLLIAAAILMLLGLAFLALGLRRRYQE